jgi:hypothetical protein
MYNKQVFSRKPSFLIPLLLAALLIVACGSLLSDNESPSPKRFFELNDLIINQSNLPPSWQLYTPFYPSGDDLVTQESLAIRFGKIVNQKKENIAEEGIYRYPTIGIAKRKFDYWFIEHPRISQTATEWQYLSLIASQSHFACETIVGGIDEYCEWAGRYEEFIIVLGTKMIPGEMTFNDLEKMVKVVDSMMALYLSKPLPSKITITL